MSTTTPSVPSSSAPSTAPAAGTVAPTPVAAPIIVPPTQKFGKTVVRSKEQKSGQRAQYSRNWRENCTSKEKSQFIKDATTGLTKKISKIDYDKIHTTDADFFLEKNISVETFIDNIRKHCVRYDIAYTFQNFPLLDEPVGGDEWTRARNGRTIDLFEEWDQIGEGTNKKLSVEQISETINWLKDHTIPECESYIDDLDWTHLFILDSVDEALETELSSRLRHDFEAWELGGPLTFGLMIDRCINLSTLAIDNLKRSLKVYDIKTVPGENLDTVIQRFEYAFQRLENNNAVDSDLERSLFKVFQTTSVDSFNALINHWEKTSALETTTPSYCEMFKKISQYYKDARLEGDWNGVSDKAGGSGFQFKKGGKGHGKSPYSAPEEKDSVCSAPKRYSREIHGKTMKYCAKCTRFPGSDKLGRWNVSHWTDEHHGGKPAAGSANLSEQPKEDSKKKSFAEGLLDAQA